MKVFVAIILALGSASALGSGPYLPSGWRPQGPAFFLPSEVQKPALFVKEAAIEETVASGSDALREYGPPKVVEVTQVLTNQGLPDATIEQTFLATEAKFNQDALTESVAEKIQENAAIIEKVVEEAVTLGVISVEEPTTTTAAIAIEEIATEDKSAEVIGTTEEKLVEVVEAITEATTEVVDVNTTEAVAVDSEISAAEVLQNVQSFQNVQDATEVDSTERTVVNQRVIESLEQTVQTVEELVQVEVKAVEEEVKNVAEALVNLENEIKTEEVQTQVEIKTLQENSSLEQGPVGFLEYGPPGFREYGPPKEEDLLRSSLIQESSVAGSFDNNETRKRRFSPKFRPTNNKARKQH